MIPDYIDPPEVAEQRVGMVLNDTWKLLSVLASGGTSWIYVADAPWGDRAAVKILHGMLASVPTVVERFVSEGKIVNHIRHEGVVHVNDDGVLDDGVPYLVMDLLEGETLEARAERKGGTLPIPEVMWAADQVLDILYAAHKAGVVHRDIKPENIFLTNDRKIKLLDFGIARLADHVAPERTQMGTLLGTLDFMSPEQARGELDKVGVQADLWSVGATIFRLLSGRNVHDEDRIIDQIQATMSKAAAPLQQVAPDVPESIALMVDYALAFDAPQRWPNARAMRNALMVANSVLQEQVSSSQSISVSSGAQFFGAPDVPPMSMRFPSKS
jgi:serine/threonine-protein kinase